MTVKKLIPIVLTATAFSLFSCNKDKDNVSETTNFLTRAGWKMIKQENKNDAGVFVEEPIDECSKDDILQFKTDHTLLSIVGIKCDIYDTDDTDTWAFGENEQTIIIGSVGSSTEKTYIDKLDNDNLIVTDVFIRGTEPETSRYTFIH